MPQSLFSTLVIRGVKSETVGLVVPRGRPKYGNGIELTLQPKVLARCEGFYSGMFIGTRKDLLKLTCRPVESENGLRRHFRLKRILALLVG